MIDFDVEAFAAGDKEWRTERATKLATQEAVLLEQAEVFKAQAAELKESRLNPPEAAEGEMIDSQG